MPGAVPAYTMATANQTEAAASQFHSKWSDKYRGVSTFLDDPKADNI